MDKNLSSLEVFTVLMVESGTVPGKVKSNRKVFGSGMCGNWRNCLRVAWEPPGKNPMSPTSVACEELNLQWVQECEEMKPGRGLLGILWN